MNAESHPSRELFQSCETNFQTRCQDRGLVEKFVRLGEQLTVRLRFAGAELAPFFLRALSHLQCDPTSNFDLDVCLWDSEHAPVLAPNLPLDTSEQFGDDSEPVVFESEYGSLSVQSVPGRMSLMDTEMKRAYFWISHGSEIPYYSYQPLWEIIQWWTRKRNICLLHAACVGKPDAAILIIGKKGAGKSTSSLSCLSTSLQYLCDDACLVKFTSTGVEAHSIFNTGRLRSLDLLPHLAPHVANVRRPAKQKAYIFVDEEFPGKCMPKASVVAVAIPTLTNDDSTHVQLASNQDVLKMLLSSTTSLLPEFQVDHFFSAYRLFSTLPCYWLNCGRDMENLNQQIEQLIQEYSSRNYAKQS